MKKQHLLMLAALAVPVLSACSEFHSPTPHDVLTHPFGTQAPFSRGTSKNEVLADWGNPDQVVGHGVDELGNLKEEWIYVGRLPGVPVDYGYVSQTKYLYFEGDNLVRWRSAVPESSRDSAKADPPTS